MAQCLFDRNGISIEMNKDDLNRLCIQLERVSHLILTEIEKNQNRLEKIRISSCYGEAKQFQRLCVSIKNTDLTKYSTKEFKAIKDKVEDLDKRGIYII